MVHCETEFYDIDDLSTLTLVASWSKYARVRQCYYRTVLYYYRTEEFPIFHCGLGYSFASDVGLLGFSWYFQHTVVVLRHNFVFFLVCSSLVYSQTVRDRDISVAIIVES